MTDKQFTIADDLKALDVEFNMPAFVWQGSADESKGKRKSINRICAYTCGTCYMRYKNI